MGNFVREFFKIETINKGKVDKLENILNVVEEDYFNLICKNYELDYSKTTVEELKNEILNQFEGRLLKFNEKEHKSFNELYNGIVDYSDEYIYLNLKKFTGLGYIFLFTLNDGKLYTFKIADEIMNIYEEMLRSL